MKITLRQLHYFSALAGERHFGRAARQVSVTQPAMSAQIRELEAVLGGKLVDRTGTGLALTPLGRDVAERARVILDAAAEIEALANQEASTTAQIRLGMIPTVAPYLLPRFMPLIARESAQIEVSEALTTTLVSGVQNGDLDAAIIALPSGQRNLFDIPLFRDRFLLAMPKGRPGRKRAAPSRPEDIDPDMLLLLDEGHCLADQTLAACNLRRDAVTRALGATSLATVSRLVASGQGMTFIPELAADVEGRGLTLKRFKSPEPSRQIGLIARQGARGTPWLTSLTERLIEAWKSG